MKPEIVYIYTDKDGMVQLTKQGLEALIEKAYQAGREDASGTITNPWTIQPTWRGYDVPLGSGTGEIHIDVGNGPNDTTAKEEKTTYTYWGI